MSKVAIEKINEPKRGESSLLAEMDRMTQAIRQRAFDHFLGRGGLFGKDLDDWLRAERELIWTPGAEMIQNDDEVSVRVQAPGLDPENIKITATPQTILIQAQVNHTHQHTDGNVCFCDLTEKMLRRVDLPEPINVDKVTATLDKGILNVVAPKAQSASKGRTVPVVSHGHVAA
jgi:HSP20 family molecular chaperone IbpA